jgi:hypothetical protein
LTPICPDNTSPTLFELLHLFFDCVGADFVWCEFDSQQGWTALIWAARQGHVDCVRLLIDAGADKNAKADRVSVALFIDLLL